MQYLDFINSVGDLTVWFVAVGVATGFTCAIIEKAWLSLVVTRL